MIEGFRFRFHQKTPKAPKRLRFPGMSFGYGDCDPFVVAVERNLCVARIPSRREWNQLGSSMGHQAEWVLFGYGKANADGDHRIEKIYRTMTPGRCWKGAKRELLQLMRNIHHAERREPLTDTEVKE